MDADWSVELGHDDPALDFPWSSSNGSKGYVDLLQRPELLSAISEASQYPELGEFLLTLNAPSSHWLTAKCDVWLDHQLDEAEGIYGMTMKQSSYVDLISRDPPARFSFERHERWAKSAARRLSSEDEDPVACEFIVRRCWYHTELSGHSSSAQATPANDNPSPSFYVTLYLFGYADDEAEARTRWATGLRQVASVLTELAP